MDKDMEVIIRRFPRPHITDYVELPQSSAAGTGAILAIKYLLVHIIEIFINLWV